MTLNNICKIFFIDSATLSEDSNDVIVCNDHLKSLWGSYPDNIMIVGHSKEPCQHCLKEGKNE
jgi:hypothetical protein